MGLLSGIVHAITQPVERAIGHTATNILLPAIPITHLAANVVDKVSAGLMTPANVSQVPVQQRGIQTGVYPTTSPNIVYGAPSYMAPSYGGGGFQPSYQPTEQLYGGSPWGSSIQSFQPSTTPYPAYSAPTTSRSWEDLILGAAPFFLQVALCTVWAAILIR